MNIAARLTLAAIAAPHLIACVTDANRCVAGLRYAPEYDACLPASSPASDGGAAPAVTAAASPDGVAAASALGAACRASSDCAGRALAIATPSQHTPERGCRDGVVRAGRPRPR
jgi:hypothetical protein